MLPTVRVSTDAGVTTQAFTCLLAVAAVFARGCGSSETPLWQNAEQRQLASCNTLALTGRGRLIDEAGLSVWAAARQGHFEVARLLIAHGADVDKPSNDGSTPVKAARAAGYDDVADLLIGAGARDGKLPFVTA